MLKQLQSNKEETVITDGVQSDDEAAVPDVPAHKPRRNERRKTRPTRNKLQTFFQRKCRGGGNCRCGHDVAMAEAITLNRADSNRKVEFLTQVFQDDADMVPTSNPAWQRRTTKRIDSKKAHLRKHQTMPKASREPRVVMSFVMSAAPAYRYTITCQLEQ